MPSRTRPPRRILRTALLWLCLLPIAMPTLAQGLIRDAEIENTLQLMAQPLFRSAGLGRIDILIVDDASLNAFVVDGKAIFMHRGLITKFQKTDMIQSVIGHELAHIASGHLIRRNLNLQGANTVMGVGLLLSIVAAAAGSGEAAGGIAAGTAASAQGVFFGHTRAEETVADQIGVRYMVRAGIDPSAAIDVLDIFSGQEALSVGRQDPYARTHPLSRDRIRAVKAQATAFGERKSKPDPTLEYWAARMVAKFDGFTGNTNATLRKVKKNDTSEPADMIRAIAYHRQGKIDLALKYVNRLLAKRPRDAYYHELKGQILVENRRAAQGVQSYKRAVDLAPREPLILAGYGRALLSLKTKSGDRQALQVLQKARNLDARDARMLRDLAVAYAKANNPGMASLVTAERYALNGRFADANTNAKRAEGLLRRGSAGWLRSQDILGATRSFAKKK